MTDLRGFTSGAVRGFGFALVKECLGAHSRGHRLGRRGELAGETAGVRVELGANVCGADREGVVGSSALGGARKKVRGLAAGSGRRFAADAAGFSADRSFVGVAHRDGGVPAGQVFGQGARGQRELAGHTAVLQSGPLTSGTVLRDRAGRFF